MKFYKTAKFKKIIKLIKTYFMIAFGALIMAFGINLFLYPYKIASGGITGLATILVYLFNGVIPLGIMIIILNLPLFVAGIIKLGWKFMFRTLYATILMSVIIDITGPYIHGLGDIISTGNQVDMMLVALFGGAIMGGGMGIIFRFKATTGGTDLLAELVRRSGLNVTMGQAILIFDAVIVITAGICFKSIMLAMYAIITVVVATKVIDSILDGFNFAKGVFIISTNPQPISKAILEELGRGLTGLKGTGKYTGDSKEVLFCVVRAKYVSAVKDIVKKFDPNAFVVVANVHEVLGEGFSYFDNKIS